MLILEGFEFQGKSLEQFHKSYYSVIATETSFHIKNTEERKDLCQNTFLKVLDKIHLYNNSKGDFITWLKVLTRNTCIDFLRKENRRPAFTSIDNKQLSSVFYDKISMEQDDIRTAMSGALNSINPRYAKAVELRFLREYDYTELALELNVTPVYARMLVNRGLNALRVKCADIEWLHDLAYAA